MNIGSLKFKPIIDNRDLVPQCIYEYITNWDNKEEQREFLVTEIDAMYADGNKLCEEYNIDKKNRF